MPYRLDATDHGAVISLEAKTREETWDRAEHRNDKPVSVGTFHMDSGETAHLLVSRVQEFSKAKKFAVSLEPSGGRPTPTGPIYLASQS